MMGVDEASYGQNTEMHWSLWAFERPCTVAGPNNENSLNCVAVPLQSTEEEDKDKGHSEKQTSLFKIVIKRYNWGGFEYPILRCYYPTLVHVERNYTLLSVQQTSRPAWTLLAGIVLYILYLALVFLKSLCNAQLENLD